MFNFLLGVKNKRKKTCIKIKFNERKTKRIKYYKG